MAEIQWKKIRIITGDTKITINAIDNGNKPIYRVRAVLPDSSCLDEQYEESGKTT